MLNIGWQTLRTLCLRSRQMCFSVLVFELRHTELYLCILKMLRFERKVCFFALFLSVCVIWMENLETAEQTIIQTSWYLNSWCLKCFLS